MTILRVGWEAGRIRQFSVSGHAGFAHKGRDIVCAAASVLMTTCVNALESVAEIVPLVERRERGPRRRLRWCRMRLTLPGGLCGQAMDTAQIILRTGLQGFTDLSLAYPKHFKIIDGRKLSC